MPEMTDDQIKMKISRLRELCESLYPDEWEAKFNDTRTNFRNWLNEKTSLSVNQVTDKAAAVSAWVTELEGLSA